MDLLQSHQVIYRFAGCIRTTGIRIIHNINKRAGAMFFQVGDNILLCLV